MEQPQHRPALREQVHAQGRYRDRQPQRIAPLRFGPDVDGRVLDRLLHDVRAELRRVGHVDHARVHPGRQLLEGRQVRRVPAQQPAACADTSTTHRRSASRPRTARCRPSRQASTTASKIRQTATAGARANNWPTNATQAATFFNDPADGGYDFTNDPRYITLIITDNTAFSSSNTAEPVKYFAGFYATGWDTGNGSGKPKGCYGFPVVNTCGAPNNDRHPFLGCLADKDRRAPTTATCGATSSSSCSSRRMPRRATACARCRAAAWKRASPSWSSSSGAWLDRVHDSACRGPRLRCTC